MDSAHAANDQVLRLIERMELPNLSRRWSERLHTSSDEVELRQAIERELNKIEHAHRFARAVSVGNPREFIQAEKQEQEIAEGCKRLIKNCITCWNYLYLSQELAENQ